MQLLVARKGHRLKTKTQLTHNVHEQRWTQLCCVGHVFSLGINTVMHIEQLAELHV